MITIVDFGVGNLHSVKNAISMIGDEACISSSPEEILKAERIILPGVGSFGESINNLRKSGLIEALEEAVFKKGTPILGICVGFQLMAQKSFELGIHEGLAWLPAEVKKFEVESSNLKVPHVGWNDVILPNQCLLFKGIRSLTFYFVHSYYVNLQNYNFMAGICNYGIEFAAAIIKDNIFATQFHPEKSQENGLRLLENFSNWNP